MKIIAAISHSLPEIILLNGINGSSIAVITLSDIKDGVAIVLGVVSIFSTVLIIRNNLKIKKDK
jgi:hypothetical protein